MQKEYGDDMGDEELYRRARLVTSAVIAKVHTIDWTVELLKTDTLLAGMRGNWYLSAYSILVSLQKFLVLNFLGHIFEVKFSIYFSKLVRIYLYISFFKMVDKRINTKV